MKLFQQLLVAPAALGLMAPVAATAADLDLKGVSDYARSGEQITSISEFSDVRPSDWAYQALSSLVERYGCVSGTSNGSFEGNRPMTRFEAAALLNACLNSVSEINESERRLLNEFAPEIATIRGRVDGLEAKVGEFGASQFSTTTKLSGLTTYVIGGVSGVENTRASNNTAGSSAEEATTFQYDLRLSLDTSFTGEDLLKTVLRSGNFSGPFNTAAEAQLETAWPNNGDGLAVHRTYYQFPVGESLTATIGAKVRQDDMLAVWPSSYPSDSILDVLTYAGANDAYNLSMGAGAGLSYTKDQLSVSLAIVSEEDRADEANFGVLTDEGSDDITTQIAWVADNWTVAAVYTNSDGGNADDVALAADFEAYGISGQYDFDNGISLSAGLGWASVDEADDDGADGTNNNADDIEDRNTWSVGLVWRDLGAEGNNLGVAYGTAEGHRDDEGYDDPMAYEVYYSIAVSDNITITPAYFEVQRDGAEDINGALVKTTFTF